MPRKDRRSKHQNLSSGPSPDTSKSEKTASSILDDVHDAIPDMVDSIMAKIDESDDKSLNLRSNQSKLEKEVSSIKDDVESIKFDVVEILRQLPPREKRKPDFLGDVLNNIFSGKMNISDENITFGGAPGARYQTVPNTRWNTSISKIEEASDTDADDVTDTGADDVTDTGADDVTDTDSDLD